MKNLFIGGSSELALTIAKKLNNVDNLSRRKNSLYKKNDIISDYSTNQIKKKIIALKGNYRNVLIFNGKYKSSLLSNFNTNKFNEIFKINFIIPINIVKLVIKDLNLEKNSRIFLISSLAIDKPEIGNAYYSISKKALNFAIKVWNLENKKRDLNILNIKIGIIKNKMGLNVNRLAKNRKSSKILNQSYVANQICKIINNNKIKKDITIK